MLNVYFTPGFIPVFYRNNILTTFYNCNVTVKKIYWLLWFLKLTWFNTPTEDGTGVLKHEGVAIL